MKKRSNLEISTQDQETKPKKSIPQKQPTLISFSQFTLTPNFIPPNSGMQRVKDQQNSRSVKPITIHVLAQSGDLSGIQKRLRENPSLINDRNPVVRNKSPFFF